MSSGRILIVEDEEDIAELLSYKLRQEGFEVEGCLRGDTAFEQIRREPPDLVLLDLMLPGLDGLELCRLMRRDPATAEVPVVLLTAKAEEVDRIVGLELGADDYITKPFSLREVALRVKAVLRRTSEPHPAGDSLESGALKLDLAGHRLLVDGQEVEGLSVGFWTAATGRPCAGSPPGWAVMRPRRPRPRCPRPRCPRPRCPRPRCHRPRARSRSIGWPLGRDLAALAERSLETVRGLAAERGVELRFRAQTVPPIAGNEESLERLLLNLLENAIKYNREGGNVEVGLTTNGDELVLEVADSGIGVPRGDLRRIFERFYRVDAGRSREEGGTGLGMAIVKHAAQLRGGRVEVSSELGRGSVFRVLLPVTRS